MEPLKLNDSDHNYQKAGTASSVTLQLKSAYSQTNPDELGCCLFSAIPVKDSSAQCVSENPQDKCTQIDSFSLGSSGANLSDIQHRNQSKLIKTLKEKVAQLTRERDSAKSLMFCAENIITTPENVQYYTGLPNKETFKALFDYLRPKAENMTFWRGNETSDGTSKTRKKVLSTENQFFATVVRLRLGLGVKDLADRFCVSQTYLSRMFNTWVRFLRLELELLFPFPSRDHVQRNMPPSFHKFPNTRLIVDCTEIYVQKPSALKAQRQTWSNYKHRNIHKILIGVTPDGTILFISPLYGGAASDKFIVNNCGLLNIIEQGDNIMADSGFLISEELKKRGATLNIPPFRDGQFQLTAEQIERTRRIAEVRIHVKRAFQRIKSFQILSKVMPATLQMVAEDIFKTCSYLTNFQTPILPVKV